MIGAWWFILFIVAVGFTTGILYIKESPEPQISAWDSEHCLIGEFEYGRSINFHESNAGIYEYTVIPRSDGIIEIWKNQPCE